MKIEDYEAAAEAILFAMGEPVEVPQIAQALEISNREASLIIQNLRDRYKSAGCGLEIAEIDGAYQMRTKKEQYEYLIRIASQPKKRTLTDVQLETLSIIAYKQPVTKLEIEKIRGVSSDHAVNRLIEYGLVKEMGRMDAPGRPILFGTTQEFLRCFGMSSASDLPEMDIDLQAQLQQEIIEEIYK